MYSLKYSVKLLKIGSSGHQLKLSIGKDTSNYLRVMTGDCLWFALYRDRHLLIQRYDPETGDEEPTTPELSPPMYRLVRVEIRGSYRRCTIPSVFAKLLGLTAQDYLACRPVADYALHAWPIRRYDLLALDPSHTPEGLNP